jgi:L-alanine-DL-glutamate epimerase-like enolase superfamily enzyme
VKIRDIEAFQVGWAPDDKPAQRSAWVRVQCDDGVSGIGETSPMQGGLASLGMIRHNLAPALIGKDPLDHAVLLDTLLHTFVKLGPEGALTSALAAIDIALWDIKGKLLGQPIYKLLGGAWRTSLPFYASIGGNGERSVDEVLGVVEARLRDNPAAVKIRFDNDRTKPDIDIPGDIAKARAVRRLVGDGFPLAFDANNGYSVGGAVRVGRVLEELGYWWFEEPVQHYHVKAMGEVAQRLDITVSAGEQTYTLSGVADLIAAGVRMVQPDTRQDGRDYRIEPLRRAGQCAWRRAGPASDAAHDRAYGEFAFCGQSATRYQAVRAERSIAAHARCLRKSSETGWWRIPSARRAGFGATHQRGGIGKALRADYLREEQ